MILQGPLQLLEQTVSLRCAHTQSWLGHPWSHSQSPCALVLRDTQVLPHLGLCLRDPHTLLAPRPLHLLTSRSRLIIASDHTLASSSC